MLECHSTMVVRLAAVGIYGSDAAGILACATSWGVSSGAPAPVGSRTLLPARWAGVNHVPKEYGYP